MIILRQKLYFERTKEMKETAENLKNAKESIKKSAKEVLEKVKHPGKTAKKIKEKVVKSVKNPKIIGKALKDTGKKAWNFAKKNPRYAVYMGAGYGVPILAGKVVEKKKGKKAGVATTATLTALPLGEAAIGLDKLVTSKGGRTGLKATGQVIKGVVTDLGKRVVRKKNKLKIKRFARADYAGLSPEEATRLREYRSKLAAWAKEGRNYKKNEWTRHADRRIKNRFEELNTDMFKSKKSIRQDSWNSYKRGLGSLQGDIDFHLESFRLGDKKNTTLYHWGTDQKQEFKGPKPNNPTTQPTTQTQKPAQPTQTTQQSKPATQTTAPTNNFAPKPTQPTTPSTPKPTQTNTGGGSSLVNNKPKTSGGLVGFAKKNPRTTAMGALGLAAIGTGVLAYNKNKQKKKDEQVKSSY